MTILGSQRVIWSHNGDFEDKVHVIVQLNEDGTFHVVQTRVDEVDIDGLSTPKTVKPNESGASNENT